MIDHTESRSGFVSFTDLIQKRYSVRSYTDTPVDREKIEACVEAARLAPSACNSQPWRFLVVDKPELIKRIAPLTRIPGISMNSFVEKAPVLIALVGERPNLSSSLGAVVKKTPFYLIDIGIAAEHFCLRAAELGLGTCMLGWFGNKKIKRLLNIPMVKKLPILITLGYPGKDEIPQKARKSLADIIDYNRYKS